MESVEDVTLLGVLWSWHCSEDRVLCPVRQRYREGSGGGQLPLCCQTSHHRALSGAGLHLQMGGESVEPGTAHRNSNELEFKRSEHVFLIDSGFQNQSVLSWTNSQHKQHKTMTGSSSFIWMWCPWRLWKSYFFWFSFFSSLTFFFSKPSSVQFPVDMGSSPELCLAWVPHSRSLEAPCCACTCPSPSPSRAAAWDSAETTNQWTATQRCSPHIPLFLQVQWRPAPSFRTSQPLFQPPSQVSTDLWIPQLFLDKSDSSQRCVSPDACGRLLLEPSGTVDLRDATGHCTVSIGRPLDEVIDIKVESGSLNCNLLSNTCQL